MRLVYPRLKRIAAAQLRRESGDVSVQATGLVHELYIALVASRQPTWQDRQHFFAMATLMVRRILVARARRRGSAKRAAGAVTVPLSSVVDRCSGGGVDVNLLDLDLALTELAEIDTGAARLVELRFFGGLSIDEAAVVLGIGRTTATRRWRAARACLRQILRDGYAPRS